MREIIIARNALDNAPIDTRGRSLFMSAARARRIGFMETQIQSAMSVDGCSLNGGGRLYVWDETEE